MSEGPFPAQCVLNTSNPPLLLYGGEVTSEVAHIETLFCTFTQL